jgi:heme exporter protein D
MMPDLGKYADAVMGSYAVSLGLIAVLVGYSLWQGARMRRALAVAEARAKGARVDG